MNVGWINPKTRLKDVDKLRKTTKIGDEITYEMEKVVVVNVFRNLIQVETVRRPKRKLTITFAELLFNNRGLSVEEEK